MEHESLEAQLAQLRDEGKTKTPAEYRRLVQQLVAQLDESAAARGLGIGDAAPDFTLSGARGEVVTLAESLKRGPAVLSFYRGYW